MNTVKLGKYQHTKTLNFYRVIAVANHSETKEDMVVYECLYKNPISQLWVRPLKMFIEEVQVCGEIMPRFKYVGK